jgi:hypothetical protein
MAKTWIAAKVRYLGEGSYSVRKTQFKFNKEVIVEEKGLADYLDGMQSFEVLHLWDEQETEEEKAEAAIKRELKGDSPEVEPVRILPKKVEIVSKEGSPEKKSEEGSKKKSSKVKKTKLKKKTLKSGSEK